MALLINVLTYLFTCVFSPLFPFVLFQQQVNEQQFPIRQLVNNGERQVNGTVSRNSQMVEIRCRNQASNKSFPIFIMYSKLPIKPKNNTE